MYFRSPSFKRITDWTAAALLCALAGCAHTVDVSSIAPLPDDRSHVPKPRIRDINVVADAVDKTIFDQFEQMFDLTRVVRWATGHPKEALDIDRFGEVPNSSWFTNRNATRAMTPPEIAVGPNTGSGPDTSGTWRIYRAKDEGSTPGFFILDPSGDRYILKFDPPGFLELATGAEVAATKLFYAAGYNVPENYIVRFRPEILALEPNIRFRDRKGRLRIMTEADVTRIMSRVPRLTGGTVRAMASKFVEGEPIGPFRYSGTRKDDPNDVIPHQHRRELRGLRVIAAWLGHFDTKDSNTLDSYVSENGVSYVRHYLLDFGSTLGAGSDGPVEAYKGHEQKFDLRALAVNTLTLGLYVRPYEKLEKPPYESVGMFESSLFRPDAYKFQIPNPAFENMTGRDGFWGAKIVTSFTDSQIRAAVEAGRYSDPDAVAYLVRTLAQRRDKTARYWFTRLNPLDQFELVPVENGWRLRFTDLAVATRAVESGTGSVYAYSFRRGGKVIAAGEINVPYVDLVPGFPSAGDRRPIVCEIRVRRGDDGLGKWVRVFLRPGAGGAAPTLIGVDREG